jgi:predicted AlkP superfamily phosphohydrolase/phosphomutase
LKVLVIGLDGASPELLKTWSRELPNLTKMASEGVSGTLRSTAPPNSAAAWTSFATGMNPGKTGVFGFYQRKERSYQLGTVSFASIKQETMWSIASRHGLKVCIVNVPMTFPVAKVNGCLVAGMPCPSRVATYPSELAERLSKLKYKAEVTAQELLGPTELRDQLLALADSREAAVDLIMNEFEWDLFVVVFAETDRVAHEQWKYLDPRHPKYAVEEGEKYGGHILEVYRRVDSVVGRLVKRNQGGATFVVSDHGHGPLEYNFNINDWLASQGLMKLEGTSLLGRVFLRLDLTESGVPAKVLKRLGVRDFVRDHIPDSLVRVIPHDRYPLINNVRVDWENTRAYAYGDQSVIFVNLAGREPQGSVKSEQQRPVIDDLKQKLSRLTHDGKPLNVEIHEAKDVYSGQHVKEMPDLFIMVEGGKYHVCTSVYHENVFTLNDKWSGDHQMDGIFLARGEGIKRDSNFSGGIVDLMPTVLHLLGLSIPSEVDGAVLHRIFDDSSPFASKAAKYDEASGFRQTRQLSKEDTESIEAQLKSLGYI